MGNHENLARIIGLTAAAGAGILMYFAEAKQQNLERAAFDKLDIANMTPSQIWQAALDLSRTERRKLGAANRQMELLLDQCQELAEIAEGFNGCTIMVHDSSVPLEVKLPIVEHWYKRLFALFRVDTTQVDLVFDDKRFTQHLERVERIEQLRREAEKDPNTCSFCGKTHKQVEHLVAGSAGVAICSECTLATQNIIEAKRAVEKPKKDET